MRGQWVFMGSSVRQALGRATGIIQPLTGVIPAARGRPSTRLISRAGRACCCALVAGLRPACRHSLPGSRARALPLLAVAYRTPFVRSLRLEYGEENTI